MFLRIMTVKLRLGGNTKGWGIIYRTGCDSGSIVFIKNYKYALHVSDALCVHLQEHYKL